jgi:hypothetical protein
MRFDSRSQHADGFANTLDADSANQADASDAEFRIPRDEGELASWFDQI